MVLSAISAITGSNLHINIDPAFTNIQFLGVQSCYILQYESCITKLNEQN